MTGSVLVRGREASLPRAAAASHQAPSSMLTPSTRSSQPPCLGLQRTRHPRHVSRVSCHPPVPHHVALPRPGLAHAAAVGVGAAGADVLVHGLQGRLAHTGLSELEPETKVREDLVESG